MRNVGAALGDFSGRYWVVAAVGRVPSIISSRAREGTIVLSEDSR